MEVFFGKGSALDLRERVDEVAGFLDKNGSRMLMSETHKENTRGI